jgi:anti-sigma regulatory factor (Ser/Thr protein kinase)/anti-anti-sigma regulatory factor
VRGYSGSVPASQLACSVDIVGAVAHVSASGTLDVHTAPGLHRMVLKTLTGEPAAVLVDLSGIVDADPVALTVLPVLSRAAAAWPGAPLIAHSAPPALARHFEGSAVCRHVPLAADRAAAEAGLPSGPGPAQVSWDIGEATDGLAEARDRVRALCRRHGLTALSDNGEIVVTELLANAITHGRAPITVRVSARGRYLHVAVRDRGGGLPRLRGPGSGAAPGGRGLMIVEALTVAWGATPARDGKVVWCCLGGRQPSPASSPARR